MRPDFRLNDAASRHNLRRLVEERGPDVGRVKSRLTLRGEVGVDALEATVGSNPMGLPGGTEDLTIRDGDTGVSAFMWDVSGWDTDGWGE